jgi:uncharacterized membrane protein
VFPLLLALFGTVFALGMPPFQTPDEDSHFFRAYQVSERRLTPRMIGDWGGGRVPSSTVRVRDTFFPLAFRPEQHTSWADFAPYLGAPLAPKAREPRPFPGSAYYSFVPYLPQALGIAAARLLGSGPLGVLYAGRLANLAFGIVLLHLALRITPIFKLVFGAVALIPVTVQQLASSSPDASTIGAAFLFTAVLFRLALAGEAVVGWGRAVALLALAGWLTLCKFPYATLALLYLAVPPVRFGGWRRYLLVGAGLAAVTFSLTLLMSGLKKYTPDRIIGSGSQASIQAQVEGIRSDPLGFAQVCAATVAEHGQIWFDQLGYLGWLDTKVNPLAMHALLVLLVLLGLADHADPLHPGWRLKAAALGGAGLCTLVILFCCYVAGCAVGAPLVIGPQGRYWVPVLPLLLLPLSNRAVRVRAHPRVLLFLTAAASSAVLVVAVAGFVRRYYFSLELQSQAAPAALVAAALLFALCATVTARRYAV